MQLLKDEKTNTITLYDEKKGKKLIIRVDIDKTLDFHMELKTNKNMSPKEKSFFMIADDKNDMDAQNIYFATAKLFDDLKNTLSQYKDFYNNRFEEIPVYNAKKQCFKIHNDEGKIDKFNFIRFFKVNGIYYFVFNQNPTKFNLSRLNTRYKDFSKCFNQFYSNLDIECISKNLKVSNNKDQKTYVTYMPPFAYHKNIKTNKYGDK